MSKTVHIAAELPAAPEVLFDMYLDPGQHAAFTGMPVEIGSTAGSVFRAFDGILTGTILQVVPKRLIVQSWRSANWDTGDLDSTLILTFHSQGAGGRIELVQVNVPESDFAGVSHGWEKYYWTPWRAFLERGSESGGGIAIG